MEEFLVRHEVDSDAERMRDPTGYRIAFVAGNRLLECRNGQFITDRRDMVSPPPPRYVLRVPESIYYQQGDVLFEAELDYQEARRLFPHEFAIEGGSFLDIVFFLVDAKIKVGWLIERLETVNAMTYDGVCYLQAVVIGESGKGQIPIKHPKLVFVNRKALHNFFNEMENRSMARQFLNGYRWTVETMLSVAMIFITAGGSVVITSMSRNALRREFVRRLLRQQFVRRVVPLFAKFPKVFAVAFVKSFAKQFASIKSRTYNKRQPVGQWLNGPEFRELILKATNEALHDSLANYIKEQGWLKGLLSETQLSALKQFIVAKLAEEIKKIWFSLHAEFGNKLVEQFFVDDKMTGEYFLKKLEDKLISMAAIREKFLEYLKTSLQPH